MLELRRRQFITLLGGALADQAIPANAQEPVRVRTVAALMGFANDAEAKARTEAFQQGLESEGWSLGHNLRIEYRYAEGDSARMQALAKELVELKPDCILGQSTPVTAALMQATRTIPIMFVAVSDPIGSGFVASLARPGGNVTGLAMQSTDLVGKRLALLREVIPDLRRLAIMANVEYPFAALEMAEAQTAVRTLGLDAAIFEIRRAEDIAPAFEALKDRADALYVVGDALVATHRIQINTLALAGRLPTIHVVREFAEAGGLMSYGANFADLFRRTAEFVDKILRGAKPSEIPVEQPTRFELIINLKTAKALGLEVPPTLIARADEVIE